MPSPEPCIQEIIITAGSNTVGTRDAVTQIYTLYLRDGTYQCYIPN